MKQPSRPLPHSSAQLTGTDASAVSGSFASYTAGLAFALLLTGASFLVSQTHLLWGPGVPAGLIVLAIAVPAGAWLMLDESQRRRYRELRRRQRGQLR